MSYTVIILFTLILFIIGSAHSDFVWPEIPQFRQHFNFIMLSFFLLLFDFSVGFIFSVLCRSPCFSSFPIRWALICFEIFCCWICFELLWYVCWYLSRPLILIDFITPILDIITPSLSYKSLLKLALLRRPATKTFKELQDYPNVCLIEI